MKTPIFRGFSLGAAFLIVLLFTTELRAQDLTALRSSTSNVIDEVYPLSTVSRTDIPSLASLQKQHSVTHVLRELCSKDVSTYYLSSAVNQHNARITHPVKLVTNVRYLSLVTEASVDVTSIRIIEIQINSPDQIPSTLNMASLAAFSNLQYVHFRINFHPCSTASTEEKVKCEQTLLDSIIISDRPEGAQLFYTCKSVQ